MRWIFISLAVLNLIVFAWGMVVMSRSDSAAVTRPKPDPFASNSQILLLSEVSSVELRSKSKAIERSSGSAAVVPSRELCEIVGPFDDTSTANNFVERLNAIDVGSQVKDLELPSGPGYWVYLEPRGSRREALRVLAELHAKKIDSYVIPKGDLENGISLGMFSKKSLSDARVREMKAIGLKPKIEEIERTYREIWVMLNPGEGTKMSNLTWQRVMEGINMLERRQNYCLDVAS